MFFFSTQNAIFLFMLFYLSLIMDNFEWLTFLDNNTEFNTLCSNLDDNGLFDHFFSSYSKLFNDNFADINLSLSEPFNVNPSFKYSEPLGPLKPPFEPLAVSAVSPFVLPIIRKFF